jgi:hypothetical protein
VQIRAVTLNTTEECNILADMTTLEDRTSARRSTSGHFRIWESVYLGLEKEAAAKRVSLNTLVNQVLSTHLSDDLLMEEMRFLRMSRPVYASYLNMVPDEKLAELGRIDAKSEDSVFLARSGAITLDAVLDELQLLSRCGWFSYHREKINGEDTINMAHDLGPRFSTVVGAYLTGVFAMVGLHPKITTTSSSSMVRFYSVVKDSTELSL